MKIWFLSLTHRERMMLQVAAIVLFVFLLYLLIIKPVSNTYSKNKINIATATETLSWMKEAAREVKQLGGARLQQRHSEGKQFALSMVDQSARKAGLALVMKRVQPEGESGVRVWFENAPFDGLISWLATIEADHGLFVNEINIEKTESTGLVNVRVFLES